MVYKGQKTLSKCCKYLNYDIAFDSRFLFFKTARKKALKVLFGLEAP